MDSTFVRALYPYNGDNAGALSFDQGDIIGVSSMLSSGWWDGTIITSGTRGWFPSNYVTQITKEEAHWAFEQAEAASSSSSSRLSTDMYKDLGSSNHTDDTSLDTFTSADELEQAIWASLGGSANGSDLTSSFSTGGNIFAEIAAANTHRRKDSYARSSPRQSPSSRKQSLPASVTSTSMSPSHSRQSEKSHVTKMDDYWEPKLTNDGQIIFVNSRTGDTSTVLPSDSTTEDLMRASHRKTDSRRSNASTTSDTDSIGRRTHTATSSMNANEWITRTLDDGVTMYYENVKTRETRWSLPGTANGSPSVVQNNKPLPAINSTQRQVSDVTARPSKHSDDSTVSRTPKVSPNPPLHQSQLSFDSDDSGADVRLNSAKTANGFPKIGIVVRPRPIDLPLSLAFFETPFPILAQLDASIQTAVRTLVAFAQPSQSTGSSMSHDLNLEEPFDREKISDLTADLVAKVRTLVHVSGLSDTSAKGRPISQSGSSSSPNRKSAQQSAAELRAEQLKPYAKRVTSPLNKLVLNVRALWGTMNTSVEEEQAIQHAFIAVELEEDVYALKEHRHDIVRGRLASDSQLRSDIAAKAQDLGKAIALLVAFLATMHASSQETDGPPAGIVAKADGNLVGDVHALLGAGNGRGANWKGNGFSTVSPAPKVGDGASRGATTPVPSIRPAFAKSVFNSNAVSAYALLHDSVTQDIADIQGSLANLKRNVERQRDGFNDCRSAGSTSRLSSSNEAALKQAVPLLTSITNITHEAQKCAASVEDWNISDALDIDTEGSTLASLLAAQRQASSDSKGKGKAVDQVSVDDYKSSLKSARSKLQQFNEWKQAMYDATAILMLRAQDLAILEVVAEPGARESDHTQCFSQPPFASPLNDFTLPEYSEDILGQIDTALTKLQAASSETLRLAREMVETAHKQAQASPTMRSANEQRRTLLETHRLSQISLSSSTSSRHSDRGTITSTKQSHSSLPSFMSVNGVPPSAVGSAVMGMSSRPSPQRPMYLAGNHSYANSEDSLVQSPGPNGLLQPPLTLQTDARQQDARRSETRPESYSESIRSKAESDRSSLQYLNGSSGMHKMPSQTSQESPTARSPSTSKIKQFFGNDAPAPEFGRKTQPSPPEVPAYLRLDFESELSMLSDQVKGGTLRALVARLTSHEHTIDHTFIKSFLLTYRTFTTCVDLFKLLVQRYHAPAPPGLTPEQTKTWISNKQTFIRMRTVNVLKTWLESYFWEPPQTADAMLKAIHDFASNGMADQTSTQQVTRAVDRRRSSGLPRRMSAVDTSLAPAPIMPRFSKRVKFLDIDATELARQLTIISSQQYCRITPDECMSKAWPKKFGSETPNISAMTAFENNTASWVQETIMISDDAKKRASAIKHFVSIAERCYKLQNFSILVHIIAGLDGTPIRRLRRTWEIVNSRTMSIFEMLKTFMSPDRKFAQYREALRTMGPPCVPFMGVFLTSWTYIGDAMPDFLAEQPDHINFTKRQRAAELMQQIELHQSTPYNLHAVSSVADYLQNAIMTPSSDAALWERSLQLEPREREDEKIARLLSESGFL